jgi:predicted ABC-type exoprotein transport system permease subunit
VINLHQFKEGPKGKNTISFKEVSDNITWPYLITIDSIKQMWLNSDMYFQINEMPAMYLFVTYYSMESFCSRTKVNTLLLSSLPLFLNTLDLITWYIIFLLCKIFISPCIKQNFNKYYWNTQAHALG